MRTAFMVVFSLLYHCCFSQTGWPVYAVSANQCVSFMVDSNSIFTDSVIILQQPNQGTVNVNQSNFTITYCANAGFSGIDSIYVREKETMSADDFFWIYFVSQATGMVEKELTNVRIFPNPAKNFVIVQNCSNCIFEIFNSTGQLITKGLLSEQESSIETALFPKGVFFIRCADGTHSLVYSIVKE